MECTLLHWYDLVGAKGNNTMTVAIGKIERIHIVGHFSFSFEAESN